MGQGSSNSNVQLKKLESGSQLLHHNSNHHHAATSWQNFRDLKEFPPEVALSILSNLNATDLCLASCVWQDLAEDEILWKSLCNAKWKSVTIYKHMQVKEGSYPRFQKKPGYKKLYLLLDEATLIFAFRPNQGIQYLVDNEVLEDTPVEIAKFFDGTSELYAKSIQTFLLERNDVFEEFIKLQNFKSLSLCDGLRKYFKKVPPPEQHGNFLHTIVEKFAGKFYDCNLNCEFNKENIAVLCYSVLLLSVDLYSPHVKNKMSKREFIRNNRQVLVDANRDVLSDIYDDVYLNGHIVPNCTTMKGKTKKQRHRFPFYRPYGAIFELKPIELKLNCSC